MSRIILNRQFIVDKGREIYYKIRPELKKKYNEGHYVTIEVNSGKYFIGKTPIEAMDIAKKHFPKRKFYMAQVGSMTSLMK
ncbi:hypothetical protein A2767_06590 [Candidatus Roizmanbacteria bacterium RIFCSPHIGHO2_01_FULL_35_10]|uniref:DUF5678 domain-containing protein n=1 Tax=Candidatus Roizmanbacteria bacterium RIFCSPLOWO2_01_FULL_35_13 TaxID=1802055 RepID=A0A1F7IAL6_9BACT|nr:MAG: hypothetical protein A2767_06590 [Candidatus Roizmanbacteria bacterium RIFCSPHIGHO2_01_FULL_35_10]OGK40406.1 MAG: hypothetical protein A3A74_01730 [Candidatus Roizmanbacteria bacterium RIFCSPLOWO2_01_FULL_35_13]